MVWAILLTPFELESRESLLHAPAVAPNITGQQPHMNLMLSLMIESKANHSKKRGEVSGVVSGVSFWFLTSFELSGACFSNCDYHSFIRNSIAHDCIWVLTAEVNDSRKWSCGCSCKILVHHFLERKEPAENQMSNGSHQ